MSDNILDKTDKIIIHFYNCNSDLKYIVSYLQNKGVSKNLVVSKFKKFCRKYGYNNNWPNPDQKTKYNLYSFEPMENNPTLLYSKRENKYYNKETNRIHDELSATHNGLIGLGSQFKNKLKTLKV